MDNLKSFLTSWLTGYNMDPVLIGLIVTTAAIIGWVLIGSIFHIAIKIFISRLKAKERHMVRRQRTVTALILALIKYMFWFVMAMMVLKEFGLDLAPILASAGILGFAVGFGAQELIKDMIAGFFIIFEGAMNVGDFVEVGSFSGTVQEVGIRRTKILNWKNELRLVNNGDIKSLTNFSGKDSVGVVEFFVSAQFDLKHFTSDSFNDLLASYTKYEVITELPSFQGVVDSQLHNLKLRVIFKTQNQNHYSIERDLRRDIQIFIQNIREETKVF